MRISASPLPLLRRRGPAAAKFLRWLLLLPGGDRVKGLQEMLQARERGELLRGEADYQLHLVYLWYEQKPRQALDLLELLEAHYPSNPLFLQRIAEVESEYFQDHAASAAGGRPCSIARAAPRVDAPLAEVRARLGWPPSSTRWMKATARSTS